MHLRSDKLEIEAIQKKDYPVKRIDIIIVALLITCMGASAALINGDMSNVSLAIDGQLNTNNVNQGWHTYIDDAWRMTNGVMMRGLTHVNNDERSFAQLFTDPALTGEGVVSFDVVATNSVGSFQSMNWWLIGYTVTNNPVQFDAIEEIEVNLIDSARPLSGANYSVTYLASAFNIDLGSSPGSASSNFFEAVDFGTGYDYYGFAFSANNPTAGDYIHVDNVSVAIPEPASFGLLLLGITGLRMYRHMKRS